MKLLAGLEGLGDSVAYTGRITAFILVLMTNSLYITYYFYKFGNIETIEYIGLPIMLILAWWCGKQYDKAKFLSEKDPLTRLYNRRFVQEFLPKGLSQADRNKGLVSVSILDVDNFKKINDTYGHKKGDLTLRTIANVLVNHTRKCDLVCRWGGDEFLIITPNTDRADFEVLVKRIDQTLLEKSIELAFELSVSIGTATYPMDANNLDELLKIADHAMYQIKRGKKKID